MTVQLNWPAEVVDRLTREAGELGLSLDEYVLRSVLHGDGPDEAARAHAREEAARSIREVRKGNLLGPDLTIRDLMEEGRRF